VDAARGASSVIVVPAPVGRPEADPAAAREMMAGLVFLPAYPELSRRSLMHLVAAVGGAAPELQFKPKARPGRAMQS
jgi:hypothetical protein